MTDIAMPRLSDSMEQGTILKWLIADGAHVASGQDLVEIETDKATIAYPADAEGTLEILAAEHDAGGGSFDRANRRACGAAEGRPRCGTCPSGGARRSRRRRGRRSRGRRGR
jgi:pyruvate dehydrogenase E2 component (dihydrolipoamide acetyltransferase)